MWSHLGNTTVFPLSSTGTVPVDTRKDKKLNLWDKLCFATTVLTMTTFLWKGTWDIYVCQSLLPISEILFWKTQPKKPKESQMGSPPDCTGQPSSTESPLTHSSPISPSHKQMENEKDSQVWLWQCKSLLEMMGRLQRKAPYKKKGQIFLGAWHRS